MGYIIVLFIRVEGKKTSHEAPDVLFTYTALFSLILFERTDNILKYMENSLCKTPNAAPLLDQVKCLKNMQSAYINVCNYQNKHSLRAKLEIAHSYIECNFF